MKGKFDSSNAAGDSFFHAVGIVATGVLFALIFWACGGVMAADIYRCPDCTHDNHKEQTDGE